MEDEFVYKKKSSPFSRPSMYRAQLDLEYNQSGDETDDNDSHAIVIQNYRHSFDPGEDYESQSKKQKLKTQIPRGEIVLDLDSDWSDHERFVLLEFWGDRFLQLGRRSLRSKDWKDVAEKVSETTKIERTEWQCRKMIHILKSKYAKEKERGTCDSSWVYFRKMDMLMNQEGSNGLGFCLPCGMDSGEYVFTDTDLYLDCANVDDEMRDTPCSSENEEDDSGVGGIAREKKFKMLIESVQKFAEIYEKIEIYKREQMMELEKMKSDFEKETCLQRKLALEQMQAEIAKIREENGDEVKVKLKVMLKSEEDG